jgi:hypothetical protein
MHPAPRTANAVRPRRERKRDVDRKRASHRRHDAHGTRLGASSQHDSGGDAYRECDKRCSRNDPTHPRRDPVYPRIGNHTQRQRSRRRDQENRFERQRSAERYVANAFPTRSGMSIRKMEDVPRQIFRNLRTQMGDVQGATIRRCA